jgi:putative SOS response-associated peptidase YedK
MRHELRYTLSKLDGLDAFGAVPSSCAARTHVVPGDHVPVAVGGTLELRRWGLLRRWQGHGGKRGAPIVIAPVDVVPLTPQLRDAEPCLVFADGLLAQRSAIELWVHPEPPRLVAFAGLAETSRDDDVPSFAVLVGTSLVHTITQAMPIVVAPDAYARWLDARELVPADGDDWRADAPAKIQNQAQRELF